MKKLILLLVFHTLIFCQQNWSDKETSQVEDFILFGAWDLTHNYLNNPSQIDESILYIYFDQCFPLLYDETISAKKAMGICKSNLENFIELPLKLDATASKPIKYLIKELEGSLSHMVGYSTNLNSNQEFSDFSYYYMMHMYLKGKNHKRSLKKYRDVFKKAKSGSFLSETSLVLYMGYINVDIYEAETSSSKYQKLLDKLEDKFDSKLYKNRSSKGLDDSSSSNKTGVTF